MTKYALIDASCDAFGHPTECQEPAPGTVQKDSSHDITVTVDGQTKEIGTIATATMHFNSHAHDYDPENGCHDYHSHDIDPDGDPSITINGSPVYEVADDVTTDPVSGGSVDIVSNPFNTEIQ